MANRPCHVALLLALGLAACADPAEREASALRQAVESGRASLAAVSPTAFQPATSPTPTGSPASPVAEAGGIAGGPGPATAAQLLGLGPDALRRWLGEPSLRRTEGGAEVWLYAGAACALDLVLYPEAGRLRVAHASARASGTAPRTEAACLRELAAAPAPVVDRGA